MSIDSVYVNNFRNLVEQRIQLNRQLNFIIGDNGSGKSSFLEAIFFVGHGKSFRTTKSETVCHFDKEEFFINVKDEEQLSFGLSKHKDNVSFLIKKQGNRINKLSELADHFAVQIVTPESFKLFFGGAKERRKFLDLGLFHVEHKFGSAWKVFSKILKHRNACIKSRLDNQHFTYWTNEFVNASLLLSELRQNYCKQLSAELSTWLNVLMPDLAADIQLSYFRGWSASKELSETLLSAKEKEFKQGFTAAGAHKFDIKFLVSGKPIELKLSRGQQKLFLVALTFAQMKLIEQVKQVKAILLIDDIGAELDVDSRSRFYQALKLLNCQVAISAIDVAAIQPLLDKLEQDKLKQQENYTMFHVEHGKISRIEEIG